MEVNASNHQGYSIIEEPNGNDFYFITDYGVKYRIYFAEADGYAPSASFCNDLRMFGFEPVDATRPPGRLPADDKVVPAILETLYYYISQHPSRILLYVCSEDSSWLRSDEDPLKERNPLRAKRRSELFHGWYNEYKDTIDISLEKIDYGLYGQVYASCLFRLGHSQSEEIREVIQNTVAQKGPVL